MVLIQKTSFFQSKEKVMQWEAAKKWRSRLDKVKRLLKEKEEQNFYLTRQLISIKDLYAKSVWPLVYQPDDKSFLSKLSIVIQSTMLTVFTQAGAREERNTEEDQGEASDGWSGSREGDSADPSQVCINPSVLATKRLFSFGLLVSWRLFELSLGKRAM